MSSNSDLLTAVKANNVDLVRKLLESGIDESKEVRI